MKRKAKNITLIILGACIGLIICEIILSILHIPQFYKPHSSPLQFRFLKTATGERFYTNLPSSDIKFVYDGNPRGYLDSNNAVYHSTNSLGFRGKEFSLEKPPGTFRIAVLGDSFTFGEGVKNDDVFSERLAQLLNNQNRGTRKFNFEVLNFGVGGYNTEQSLFLLNNMVLKTKPDMIILGYVLNDAKPKLFYFDKSDGEIKKRPNEEILHRGLSESDPPETHLYTSRTAQLIWKIINSRKLSEQTIRYYNSLYESSSSSWNVTKDSLREFIGVCETHNIDCYIVLFPMIFRLNESYPFKHLHQLIENEITSVRSNKIHFIDLFAYLKGQDDRKLWVHPTDQHPNEIVHETASKAIFSSLLKQRKDFDAK